MTNERLVERAPVIPRLFVAVAVGSAAFLSKPAGATAVIGTVMPPLFGNSGTVKHLIVYSTIARA